LLPPLRLHEIRVNVYRVCVVLWFSLRREQAPALHLYCQPDVSLRVVLWFVFHIAVVFVRSCRAGACSRRYVCMRFALIGIGFASCCGFPCGGSEPPPYIYIVSPMVSLRAVLWFSLRRERAPALHLYCQPDGIVAGRALVFLAAGASPRPTFILSAQWYRCGQCCGFPCGGSKPPPYICLALALHLFGLHGVVVFVKFPFQRVFVYILQGV